MNFYRTPLGIRRITPLYHHHYNQGSIFWKPAQMSFINGRRYPTHGMEEREYVREEEGSKQARAVLMRGFKHWGGFFFSLFSLFTPVQGERQIGDGE